MTIIATVKTTWRIALPKSNTDAQAIDKANETLREHQRSFAPRSQLLDYELGEPRIVPPQAGSKRRTADVDLPVTLHFFLTAEQTERTACELTRRRLDAGRCNIDSVRLTDRPDIDPDTYAEGDIHAAAQAVAQ